MLKTGKLVGAQVKRTEGPRVVTGNGNYVGGMKLPGMLELEFCADRRLHALITRIDASPACAGHLSRRWHQLL